MKTVAKLVVLLGCMQMNGALASTIDGSLGESTRHLRAELRCSNTGCMAAHDAFDDDIDDDDGDTGDMSGLGRSEDDDG